MAFQVTALFLLSVVCIGFAAGQIVADCCLEYTDKHLPRQILASYINQEAGRGCQISATVFLTKAGKRLCAPPKKEKVWVHERITFLDNKNKQKSQ